LERWISTVSAYQTQHVRAICYLSAEFLTGPNLANNMINLKIYDETEQAMRSLGFDVNGLIAGVIIGAWNLRCPTEYSFPGRDEAMEVPAQVEVSHAWK